MLDEANLRRLAEMGIDVYVPRVAVAHTAMAAPAAVADPMLVVALPASTQRTLRVNADAAAAETSSVSVAVVLLADAASASANALVADVMRTLRFARIGCAHASAHDDAALAAASALVMFGDRHVRAVGALLPAQRQREIGWVVSAELAVLARDASAKRGLWSELKRMMRELAARTDPARR